MDPVSVGHYLSKYESSHIHDKLAAKRVEDELTVERNSEKFFLPPKWQIISLRMASGEWKMPKHLDE